MSGTLKARRVEEIEIALRHFHETDEAVDRGEPCAQLDIARVLLAHRHDEVAAVRHVGRLGLRIHAELIVEEVQPLQTIRAALHTHHVKHLAGRHGKFAADDTILGLRVAFDLDLLDVSLVTLIDVIDQVHVAGLGVRVLARRDPGVDVALRAVHVLHDLHVLVQRLGRESLADAHLELGRDVVRGEQRYSLVSHRADLVLASLGNDDTQLYLLRALRNLLDLIQLEIDVARVAVEFKELLLVILQLIFLQRPRLREP